MRSRPSLGAHSQLLCWQLIIRAVSVAAILYWFAASLNAATDLPAIPKDQLTWAFTAPARSLWHWTRHKKSLFTPKGAKNAIQSANDPTRQRCSSAGRRDA